MRDLLAARPAIAWAVLGASLCALFLACTRQAATPEERIRALLDQAARDAAARKPDRVVNILAPDFAMDMGGERIGRDEVKRFLALELLRGKWISVTISGAEVVVDGGRAKATVDAVLSRAADRGKGLAALLPGEAAAHRFRLDLAEAEDGWRVVSASWRAIELGDALSGPPAPDW
ncbi:MAG TPA: nuclear transport factor 2 family protein [Anaeromyxobacter sp.]|nr:nuclear transport factor 2 family protein [Anaeromyxobacter sp.]